MKSSFKKSLLVSLLTSTLGTTCFISPTYAMDGPPQEDKSTQLPRLFATREKCELIESAQKLRALSDKNKFQEAIEQGSIDPSRGILFTAEEEENYSYYRNGALAGAYKGLGDQQKQKSINFKKVSECYSQAISHVRLYLDRFEECVFQHPKWNDSMQKHRLYFYQIGGHANFCLGNSYLMNQDVDKPVLLGLFKESARYFEKVVNSNKLLKIQPEDLWGIKFNLFNSYRSIMDHCAPSDVNCFFKKANTIHREFKENRNKGTQIFFTQTEKSLHLWNQVQEANKLLQHSKGSRRVNEIREQNKEKKHLTILNEYHSSKLEDQDIRAEVLQQRDYFKALASNKQGIEGVQTIKDIERKIHKNLNGSAILEDVYEQYLSLFGFPTFYSDMIELVLPSFLETGDVEGALERVSILAQLEHKKQNNNALMTLCLRAAIKNMNGDHEEWEEFEQKINSMAEKEREKKKAAKRRQQEKRAEEIRNCQQPLPLLEDKNDKSKEELKPQKSAMQPKEPKTGFSGHPEDSFNSLLPPVSSKEAKDQKRKRHEEAERQRQKDENNLMPPLPPEITRTRTPQPSVQEVHYKIKDLFLLTGVAKNVDDAIEDGTWKFTRENLILYFKALGCTEEKGAKHKKVALPQAVIISYEDVTLTIMNDLGGALTLPRWDGADGNGTVPSFLRRQFLIAREKLVLLKLKANQTISNNNDAPNTKS